MRVPIKYLSQQGRQALTYALRVSHDDEPPIISGGTGDVGGYYFKTRRGRATRLPAWLKRDYILN